MISHGILFGPIHQIRQSFNSQYLCTATGNRQSEVTQTTKQIGNPLSRRRLKQIHCPFHHQIIQFRINLSEPAYFKRHFQIKIGKLVNQPALFRPQCLAHPVFTSPTPQPCIPECLNQCLQTFHFFFRRPAEHNQAQSRFSFRHRKLYTFQIP